MISTGQAFLYFFLFPGLPFMIIVAMLASYVEQKATARIHYRVGPHLLHPVWDFLKLLGKETTIPAGAPKVTFFGAPLLGLVGVIFAGTLVGVALFTGRGFFGDVIVAMYMLLLPPIALILGGLASRNPLAVVGANRQVKLMIAYELPFILAVLVPIIKFMAAAKDMPHATEHLLRIENLVWAQYYTGSFAASASGVIALIVAVICMQGKLGLSPFDQAEAETELAGGVVIDYSGPSLALFHATKTLMLYAVPMFIIALFWGGFGITRNAATGVLSISNSGVVLGVVKYFSLILIVTLIKNTNPRVRIDQAVRFFWYWITVPAIAAVVLAVYGL